MVLCARPRFVALALFVSALGCVTDPTGVRLILDTDLPIDQPLTIRVFIRQGDVAIDSTTSRPEQTWARGRGDGGITLPASFGIVPAADQARDGLTTVLVEGQSGGLLLRRLVRFRFVPNQTLTVRVFLTGRCALERAGCTTTTRCTRQTFCEERAQTCGDDGECVDVTQTGIGDGGMRDVSTTDIATADLSRIDARDACVPDCTVRGCGQSDGCGGVCMSGTCGPNETCALGTCVCATGFSRCGAAGTCRPAADVECAPSASRVQACGNCGQRTDNCDGTCHWIAGACVEPPGACAPGATRNGPCGRCGTQAQSCSMACQWANAGVCMEPASACTGGAVESRACGNCGTSRRTCSALCQWSAWGACVEPAGACAPGSARAGTCDPCSQQVCNASCQWAGCTLRPGNACENRGGLNARSCSACACGLQWCLPSCQWSTACTSCCSTCGGCS